MIDKIFELTNLINQNNFIEIKDSDNFINVKFKYENCDKNDFVDAIINIIITFPYSLSSLISLKNYPSLKKSDTIPEAKLNLQNHINKHISLKSAQIEYELKIEKKVLTESSNYNINCFWNLSDFTSLLLKPIINIDKINNWFSYSNYNIIIIINSKEIFIQNNTTLIVSPDYFSNFNNIQINNLENINQKIEFKSTHCNIEFSLQDITPDFFIFDFKNTNFIYSNELKILLNNLFSLFFILFICNSAVLKNNTLLITISSNKNIIIDYNLDLSIERENYSSLTELYFLCYNSLNVQNLYIIRNIYAIYLDINSVQDLSTLFFNKSKEVLAAVKSNLNILTIGNVEKYFSIRYSLFDFLDKNIADIQSQTSNLIQNMNKTFLSTIAALATTSFLYFKDRNIIVLKISIIIYTIYLIIYCIYSFAYQLIAFNTQQKQYKNKSNYFRPIIGTNEFDNILENFNKNDTLKLKFIVFYIITVLLYLLLIIIGLFAFFNLSWIFSTLKTKLN